MLSKVCWSIYYANKRGQDIPLIHKYVVPASATVLRWVGWEEFRMCWAAMLSMPAALNQKWFYIFCFQENLVKV